MKPTLSDSQKLRHCAGCHDDHYNQEGNSTEGRCWSLDGMVLKSRKEVHISQRPPWTQKPKMIPGCYHRPGFVFVDGEKIN